MLFALSISMIAYTGIETVSNMAEEARDPGEDVPNPVNLVLFAVLGIFAGISIVSISALPVLHTPTEALLDPAGHQVQGRPGAGHRLRASPARGRS